MTVIIKIIKTAKMYGMSNDPLRKYPAKHEHSNRTTKITLYHSNEGGNGISLYKSSIVLVIFERSEVGNFLCFYQGLTLTFKNVQ